MAIEEALVAVPNDLLDVYGIELSFPTDGNKVSSKQTPSGGQLPENYDCSLLALRPHVSCLDDPGRKGNSVWAWTEA